MEASTWCLDCKQMLQRNHEEYFVGLQAQVLELQRKVDGVAELLKRLDEKTPDRPPFRNPPLVSFSVAHHLSQGTTQPTNPPMTEVLLTRQSQMPFAPATPKQLLQRAMPLMMQQRR